MKIPIIRVRDADGNIVEIPAIVGPKGDKGDPGTGMGNITASDVTCADGKTVEAQLAELYPIGVGGSVDDLTDGAWAIPSGNGGPNDAACTVYHKTWDGNFKSQVAISAGDGRLYFRAYGMGSWYEWEMVANTSNHAIKSYVSLGQLGLTNDDMSPTDLAANLVKIVGVMPANSRFVKSGATSLDNLAASIATKLAADVGVPYGDYYVTIDFDGKGANGFATEVKVTLNYGTVYTANVYSCVFYDVGTLTPFGITSAPLTALRDALKAIWDA